MRRSDLLVVGAGPYGIAVAAYAQSLGIDVAIVGKPLEAWTTGMPRRMFLRSAPDWHLDARESATFARYVRERGLSASDLTPVPRTTFVEYASWFMAEYHVRPHDTHVTRLTADDEGFVATLADGAT